MPKDFDIEINPVCLRKGTKIGELDAESDSALLKECFVELPEFQKALDCSENGSIVLGRVGSGKSALVLKLRDNCENPVWLDPESLSFQYLENSAILKFVDTLGVNLNTFYKLLWRHILVVELLKSRFQITDSRVQHNFLESISKKLGVNDKKRKALEYVREWGDKFWEETETRVKEVTKKFESQLGATLGAEIDPIKFSLSGQNKLSAEQKEELTQRASKVVNEVQIKRLAEVIELLSEDDLFGDTQRRFHILIDGLDNNWATTSIRCRLIRALIEEIRTFRKLPAVKVVMAIRRDLLSLVFDKTRDSGFQEEKYDALLIELKWNDVDLKNLVDSRLREVFTRQYSNASITSDVLFLSVKGGGVTPMDYMIQRTLRRPRDIIQFVNESLKIAENKSRISLTDIRKAENVYSEKRINSLMEEWSDIYPSLAITIELLRNAPARFGLDFFTSNKLHDIISKLSEGNSDDPCASLALRMYDAGSEIKEADVLNEILRCFYKIGLVGIKTDSNDALCFAWKDQPTMSRGEVSRCVKIQVHKMAWQALNIAPDESIET